MGCAGSIEQASRPVERKTQQDVSIRKVSGSAKVTPEVEPPSARRKSERPSPGVAQQNGDPSVSKNSNRGGHRRESVDDVQVGGHTQQQNMQKGLANILQHAALNLN